MAQAAMRRGIKVIAFTDHSQSLGVTGGLTIERHFEQQKEIEEAQHRIGDGIRILHATEVEIKADGELDYPDEFLATLDLVLASLHTSLRQPREKVTQRLLNAINNPHVDIIGHPTGRKIPDREGADLDMEAVIQAAAQTGVALEINASPYRLDLDDKHARRAREVGVKISINTDSHSEEDMAAMHFGVAIARRAWLTPDHVINTWEPDRLLAWLKKKQS
jgi:DNA polymerase (family 10)